jgi:hypothetical protein
MRTMNRHPVCTTSNPKPARRNIRAGVVLGALCLILWACSTVDDRRPKGTTKPLSAAESRLAYNLPALSAAKPDHRRYTSADGRFVEEYATWTGGSNDPIAGLLISEAAGAVPLLDAESPERTVDLWSALRDKKPGFGTLKQAPAAAGPISWIRASIGTRICAVFLQRREPANGKLSSTRAVLTGYFCNPPGASLDPDTAEAAVKAAGLRGHAPPQ